MDLSDLRDRREVEPEELKILNSRKRLAKEFGRLRSEVTQYLSNRSYDDLPERTQLEIVSSQLDFLDVLLEYLVPTEERLSEFLAVLSQTYQDLRTQELQLTDEILRN